MSTDEEQAIRAELVVAYRLIRQVLAEVDPPLGVGRVITGWTITTLRQFVREGERFELPDVVHRFENGPIAADKADSGCPHPSIHALFWGTALGLASLGVVAVFSRC